MSFTRFCLLNQTENKLLSRKLNDAIRRWHGEWFPEHVSPTVALVQPSNIEMLKYCWTRGTVHPGLAVAVGVPAGMNWGLGLALTGLAEAGAARAGGDIARDLEIETLRGLARAVLVETGRVEVDEPIDWSDGAGHRDSFDSKRGFVAAECKIQGSHVGLPILLYPETTAAYVAELGRPARVSSALVPARRAIESQPVRVNILLGEAELLLGEVVTLSVGDVLRLDCSISDPLQAVIPEGGVLCRANLGTAGDRKAVQLLGSPSLR